MNGKVRKDIVKKRIVYVMEDLMYFRKFNALHGYIVEHYNEGVDDCRPIRLHYSIVKELIEVLKNVKNVLNKALVLETADGVMYDDDTISLASEIMPPSLGFFFGSHTIDEYYARNVDLALKGFEEYIRIEEENHDKGMWMSEIEYVASW
jgi:hypothetical protein